ncbi:MAG: hypothetical protein AAGJ35_07395, partial [Myxococcota bacterium]
MLKSRLWVLDPFLVGLKFLVPPPVFLRNTVERQNSKAQAFSVSSRRAASCSGRQPRDDDEKDQRENAP